MAMVFQDPATSLNFTYGRAAPTEVLQAHRGSGAETCGPAAGVGLPGGSHPPPGRAVKRLSA